MASTVPVHDNGHYRALSGLAVACRAPSLCLVSGRILGLTMAAKFAEANLFSFAEYPRLGIQSALPGALSAGSHGACRSGAL